MGICCLNGFCVLCMFMCVYGHVHVCLGMFVGGWVGKCSSISVEHEWNVCVCACVVRACTCA